MDSRFLPPQAVFC